MDIHTATEIAYKNGQASMRDKGYWADNGGFLKCSRCSKDSPIAYPFCPYCGIITEEEIRYVKDLGDKGSTN